MERAEIAALREVYPAGGLRAARTALPGRTDSAIANRAGILGLNVRVRPGAWTEEDVAILRTSYASGGRRAAIAALPHRTTEAISQKAKELGIARGWRRRVPEQPPAARVLEPQRPRVTIRSGACDHGDREHIRKRLDYVFADLSRETGRSPAEVRRAVVDLALDGFVERKLSAIDRESVS